MAYIHRDIGIDIDEVINRFALKKIGSIGIMLSKRNGSYVTNYPSQPLNLVSLKT